VLPQRVRKGAAAPDRQRQPPLAPLRHAVLQVQQQSLELRRQAAAGRTLRRAAELQEPAGGAAARLS
jgi:hypothetical protein